MSKLTSICFIVLTAFVFQTHSISIFNNITVSSDFFQHLFLKEMRLDFETSGISDTDIINAPKCIRQLQEIANQFPNAKVYPFIDSWGKFPSGLLYGHLRDLGNYDQCVKTSVVLNETLGVTTGKYCIASFPLSSPIQISENDFFLLRENLLELEEKVDLRFLFKLRLGICIPDICNPQIITKVFQIISANVLNGTLSGVKVSSCSVEKKPNFEAMDIFAISLFSTVGGLILLSTIYDCFTNYFERKATSLFMAFSLVSNGRKLFMINTKKSPNSIDCVTGIRVFSMIWVLHCHNYMFYATQNLTNTIDALTWYKRAWSMSILMGTVSVDSFFFLSGLLVAWLGLRELDKRKGKLNVVMMYVHRYIRLTPALAAVILFYVTLNKFIGSGPFRERFVSINDACTDTWWATLLYVQNYAAPDKMCVTQSWYLAIDTQLYVISPLILISLWKWGRKCIPGIVVLSLLSIGCVIATFFSRGYTSLIGFGESERTKRTYFPTHTRYSVWLVGICTGYFMHQNKQRSIKPPVVICLLGWIISFATLLSIVYGPYFTISSSQSASVWHAAAYESFKRVSWSLALAWIVFACHFGFGGIVNSILSHPLWQPLGRLNYCMYLVHMAVQTINFGTVRTDEYFSDYRLYLNFWSTFGISVLVAIVLSLSFEAPIIVIEKVIFGSGNQKDNLKEAPPSSTGNKVFIDGHVSKEV